MAPVVHPPAAGLPQHAAAARIGGGQRRIIPVIGARAYEGIHEYQAERVLAKYGVGRPGGLVAAWPEEASAIARELGGKVVATSAVRPAAAASNWLTARGGGPVFGQIHGHAAGRGRSGPQGQKVKTVLVEEQIRCTHELYLAVLVDGGGARS